MNKQSLFNFLLVIISTLTVNNSALAGNLERAEQLYHLGDFKHSAMIARNISSAAGYSLAAKATMVEATYIASDDEKYDLFQQVINDAEQVLHLEPSNYNAHLQIAVALGSIAYLQHPIEAYFSGYAEEGKHHLDLALSMAPENAWVNGLLGVWHLQIVKHASAIVAKNLYNATIENGVYHCEKAQKLNSNDIQVLYGCAVSLYELEKEPYKKQAYKILEIIVQHDPADIAELLVIQQAKLKLNERTLKHQDFKL